MTRRLLMAATTAATRKAPGLLLALLVFLTALFLTQETLPIGESSTQFLQFESKETTTREGNSTVVQQNATTTGTLKLAVVTICPANLEFGNDTLALNEAYCKIHGCDVLRVEKVGRPGDEDRVYAMLELLDSGNYNYLLWMDCDAAFVNPNVSPLRLLSHFEEGVGMLVTRHYDHSTLRRRYKCRVPLLRPLRYRRWRWDDNPNFVAGACGINSGVLAVSNSASGRDALLSLLHEMETKESQQQGFNILLSWLFQKKRNQRLIKVLYGEEMNRHLPPEGFYPQTSKHFTVDSFRRMGAWSNTPSLVLHMWGMPSSMKDRFWQCAASVGMKGERELVDKCAHHTRFFTCVKRFGWSQADCERQYKLDKFFMWRRRGKG